MDDTKPSPPAQPTTKQLRVSLNTHERVMRLAAHLNGTADDALRHLLGLSTVRVPVSDIQRERWIEAARIAGVSLPEFVEMRVEAALAFGFDPGTMAVIRDRVESIARTVGAPPTPRRPSTEDRQP